MALAVFYGVLGGTTPLITEDLGEVKIREHVLLCIRLLT